ncbi:ubiquinol-cytochrome c reductase iron-sulfur subunit [Xylella fastidiosa]|uniref:ubiquinol-cytochrome c reductase iron-sulfur subunit n=1 Tax=Xylella fastidiosa TaxID=2371 RepID=UPI0009836617|nr:ubiquinol-cytochrome c reductase iron-sulfur subunit [Xylella fastidiosa]ALR09470.2 ubiquinol-cytochrome c reductase iron-sulfur subunit [Xylella fastidiosa]WGZ33979.1 ubiquinol-cytochrome c reductase iron-sulfur subunit [Xylella fastidiosa subsp. pauca]WGZ36294.1 ubiquinol-cytochrome c reductase iron-sulfur subunit [Xylella fastidiosa subsp. pauca]
MVRDGGHGSSDLKRRRFLTAVTTLVGTVGAGFLLVPFFKSLSPSAKSKLAGAPVVVDVGGLQEGQRLILEWRGQPVWVVRRSKAVLDALPGLSGRLKDPASEVKSQQPVYVLHNPDMRSIRPEISVLVGVCTHLGCSPEMMAEIRPESFDPEWKGGYFCPCHKSRFDMSGRVFRGMPAPINLLVPPHHYRDERTLVIGVGPESVHRVGDV